jgi:hypothetical protein
MFDKGFNMKKGKVYNELKDMFMKDNINEESMSHLEKLFKPKKERGIRFEDGPSEEKIDKEEKVEKIEKPKENNSTDELKPSR